MRSSPSPVKRFALARNLPLRQPDTLKSAAGELEEVRRLRPDALVVAAYGLLLPFAWLEVAKHGAINIHASLLPRWRGAAPIERALLAGDRETGISIMRMDAGLDTGAVLLQRSMPITPDDDAGTLHDKLAQLGAEAIVAALAEVQTGRAQAKPQGSEGTTYAAKIDKRETRLDWTRAAEELERTVRALRPAPGASALLEGEALKIWRARVVDRSGVAGTVLAIGEELLVACGERALAISELQRPGGRRLSTAHFLRGRAIAPGTRFA